MSPARKAVAVTLAVAAVAVLLAVQIIPPFQKPFGWSEPTPRPVVTRLVSVPVPGPTTTVTVSGPTKFLTVPGPTKTVHVPGPTKTVIIRRTVTVSRSITRPSLPAPTVTVHTGSTVGTHVGVSVPGASATVGVSLGSPKAFAASVLSSAQYTCLNLLYGRESGWSVTASNPSGAYGIPQALPGSKMATAGADWATNGVTQVKWGLSYIDSRYGSPCNALAHSQSYGWY